MDPDEKSLTKFLKKSYIDQAVQGLSQRRFLVNQLLEKCKWPEEGWDEMTIEVLLQMISCMDSNNFLSNIGAGEREARIASNIVSRRHFRIGHGIGRSGDLTEIQPKAAGSSMMNVLTNKLALDVLRTCGVPNTKSCFIAPLATGMSLTLCLLTLRHRRPKARIVLWPRIDQKSCFKCIKTAGFEVIVIENCKIGDTLSTNIESINKAIKENGSENIVCVLSTTSCFAPRVPDDLPAIARICAEHDIPHIVNNAYGVQLSKCMHLIHEASQVGRLDCYVQSADKNFMVPVGGSIIAGFDEELIQEISSSYPGRGSASPTIDLLITFLTLGVNGYKELLRERKENFEYLKSQLEIVMPKFNEQVLVSKGNTISIAVSLRNIKSSAVTELGSMLFVRGVSGARVVASDDSVKTINGVEFRNWSSHCDDYPVNYLTLAAAIGGKKSDIDICIKKLTESMKELEKKSSLNGFHKS